MQSHAPFSWKTVLLLVSAASVLMAAQQEQKPTPAPTPIATAARLASAKAAVLKKAGNGSNIAYDVVSTTLDGWGRFTIVNTPDKADVIVEIYSVEESSGTGVSASTGHGGRHAGGGQPTPAIIRLTVYDAKTHVSLWTGTERPKGAMKKVDRENNEVEAAQHLMTKFHDDLEPPEKQ